MKNKAEQMKIVPAIKRVLVHVLTASSRDVDIYDAYEFYANSYVFKPSRSDELAALSEGLITFHRFVCLPRSEKLNP